MEEAALALGARVISVNNRNLHDFQGDMGMTLHLANMVKGQEVILCALSGITRGGRCLAVRGAEHRHHPCQGSFDAHQGYLHIYC